MFLIGCAFQKPVINQAIVPTPLVTTAVSTPKPTTAVSIPEPSPQPHCGDPLPAEETVTPVSQTVRIINQYPHDPNAFTQGLLIHNGFLYEGTGLRGRSTVRQVDLESGAVLQSTANIGSEFGEGTAVYDNTLYQLTWQSEVGYTYDLESLERLDAFFYEGEGWGLTTNGRCLIMSNGSNIITYRDPDTFSLLGSLPVQDGGQAIDQLNELEFIDGEIWANIWKSNQIVRISPTSGAVLGWIDASPLAELAQPNNNHAVLNGIAYDAENGRLYLTGKLWPILFEVEIVEDD